MENLAHPLFLLPAITMLGFLGYACFRLVRVRQKMQDKG